jgi:hypothetical protein
MCAVVRQCFVPPASPVVLPGQSVSVLHPQMPSISQAVPFALVAQSDALAHWTQTVGVALVSQILASAPVQSLDVAHSPHVLFAGLQILSGVFASFFVQSEDIRQATHMLVVVSQTPAPQLALVVHDITHVLFVRLHTWLAIVQSELPTHATHLSALEQRGLAVFMQFVSLVHWTHAPDEQTGAASVVQPAFETHATHVPLVPQ